MPATITADISANMKLLKRLEREGHIEIHVVNIENHKQTDKVQRKENPIGIYGGKFSFYGEVVYAADDTPLTSLEEIIGKRHHADVLHLESHVQSGRDYFITEDTDFLKKRRDLKNAHGTTILTPEELVELLT
jgi:predicted nucleic acid-binding protein